ncbi:hypothetical protein LOC67_03610 [Stieleria sp. JC731]|uniref:hypothetical protein n=1 Tax=Pirellulaceae TaxID=2691357 RepID=UPI001E49430A|nr:hypothetical protein [Stieleria sp. JC731]MCC9599636.1 hypothetical protein [Stieleria sp. JC731]
MDYDRDTTDSGKSSRRNRRGADSASSHPDHLHPHTKPLGPNPSGQGAPTGEIPTLFELPDCTSEGESRRRASRTILYDIHSPHSGPPAGHIDPPSGNFSKLASTPPYTPDGHAPSVNFVDGDNPVPEYGPSGTDHDQPAPERIAAYHESAEPKWADDQRSVWPTRIGVTILVFILASLSFYFGRKSSPETSSEDSIAELAINEDDSIILITGESIDADSTNSDNPVEKVASEVADTDDNLSANTPPLPDTDLPAADQTDATEDLLARIAQAADEDSVIVQPDPQLENATSDGSVTQSPVVDSAAAYTTLPGTPLMDVERSMPSSIGMPTEYQSGSESAPVGQPIVANQFFENANTTEQSQPLYGGAVDRVVSYRGDPSNDSLGNDLPQGMADRLKLEEGLQYTGTPYPIGNFLEILEAWEASELR